MRLRRHLVLGIVLLVGLGCGDGTEDLDVETTPPADDAPVDETATDEAPPDDAAYSEACGDAVRAAGEVDDLQQAADELDAAITACDSFEELQAAVDVHVEDLDVPTQTLISERCADPDADDLLAQSPICAEVS